MSTKKLYLKKGVQRVLELLLVCLMSFILINYNLYLTSSIIFDIVYIILSVIAFIDFVLLLLYAKY